MSSIFLLEIRQLLRKQYGRKVTNDITRGIIKRIRENGINYRFLRCLDLMMMLHSEIKALNESRLEKKEPGLIRTPQQAQPRENLSLERSVEV